MNTSGALTFVDGESVAPVPDGKTVEHWGGFQEAQRFYEQLTVENA